MSCENKRAVAVATVAAVRNPESSSLPVVSGTLRGCVSRCDGTRT